MVVLSLAILGLFLGPVLLRTLRGQTGWFAALDGYVVVAIGGLAVLHLLPESLAAGGIYAGIAAILGLLLPLTLEHRFSQAHGWTLAIAMMGLFVHAGLDGAALAGADHLGDHLELAVILHRLPVGLLVYQAVSSQRSERFAWGLVGALAVATVMGHAGGAASITQAAPEALGIFQAFVVGALLHVVVHVQELPGCGHPHGHGTEHGSHASHHDAAAHEHPAPNPTHRWASAAGSAAALLTLVGLTESGVFVTPVSGAVSADSVLASLVWAGAPALLLAFVVAAAMRTLLPIPRFGTGLGQGLRAGLSGLTLGTATPITACDVLPRYRRWVGAGVPAAAALGFVATAPALGIDALFLSVPLLGMELALFRVGAALLLALIIALFVSSWVSSGAESGQESFAPEKGLAAGIRYGLVDLVDHALPWILVGLVAAALAEPLIAPNAFGAMEPWMQVPLFAALGLPFYVGTAGAIPLAVIAMHKGATAGAVVAFLLTGPVVHVIGFGLLSRLHGRRVAMGFMVVAWVGATGLGWMMDTGVQPFELGLHLPGEPSVVQLGSAAMLGVLLLVSFVRQGARGMLQQVFHPIHTH